MDAIDTRRPDNAITAALADGLQAAVYAGVQQPYESIRQIASNVVHVNLPEAHFASQPEQAPTGSASWVAETVGSAAGMLPWLIASHKMVRAGSSFAGLSKETAALASGMSMREAGLTGATFSTLFQPVHDKENFFVGKAADAGIAFGTFAAGAGLNNRIRPMFGSYSSEVASRTVSAASASLSGFGAGVINAEAGNFIGKPHQDALQAGLKFGLVGGLFGAASKNDLIANEKVTAERAQVEKLGPSGERTFVNNRFEEGPARSQSNGNDLFGPRPEALEKTLVEVKARFGENSTEHASALVQLGDSHMVQGRLSNPQAQAQYEHALQIFRAQGEATPQTAWVYDKLANVKQSSGDNVGAAADLSKAIDIWKSVSGENSYATENHIARRMEDLKRMEKINALKDRKPPQIE